MGILRGASIFALLTLVIDLVPLVMALVYVARPTERNLALMRPLSLAGLFSALAGGALGMLNTLRYIGIAPEWTIAQWRIASIGAAESLVATFVGFACLTAAWLLVAVGMGRTRTEA